MYETYWQLQRRPFDNGVDPRSYYPGEAHQAALLKLRYAVESRHGAALLVGDSGCGKTLLVRLLAEQLGDDFSPFVHVVFPQMPAADLLAYLADEMGTPPAAPRSVDQNVRRIQQYVTDNARQGRHAVVVVDEAHLLRDNLALESLRLLLNFQHEGRGCLTLILVGQPGLLPALARLPQLAQRIEVKCQLPALAPQETVAYVRHRLSSAGAQREIFEPSSLPTLHRLAHGVPRQINRLCDLAMLIGFAEEQPLVGPSHIEAVAEELVSAAAA